MGSKSGYIQALTVQGLVFFLAMALHMYFTCSIRLPGPGPGHQQWSRSGERRSALLWSSPGSFRDCSPVFDSEILPFQEEATLT
jgi:hypothetical protein